LESSIKWLSRFLHHHLGCSIHNFHASSETFSKTAAISPSKNPSSPDFLSQIHAPHIVRGFAGSLGAGVRIARIIWPSGLLKKHFQF